MSNEEEDLSLVPFNRADKARHLLFVDYSIPLSS